MQVKNKAIAVFLLSAWLPVTAVIAQDFSSYSTRDLFRMRGQMTYMSEEQRGAYGAECQSRLQAMTTEERMSFRADSGGNKLGNRSGAGNGHGSQSRQRLHDGSGGGGGRGHGGGRRN